MAELTFLSISPKRAMNVAYCGSLKREFQHFLGKEDREKGSQIKKRSKERIDEINKVPHFCRLNSSRLEKKKQSEQPTPFNFLVGFSPINGMSNNQRNIRQQG